jgi:23S rRNA (uracil1939-C5)-methyltransferase
LQGYFYICAVKSEALTRQKKEIRIDHVEITDVAAEGKSLARIDNMVLFVPHTVPGDIVDVQVVRKRKRYMEGFPLRFVRYSPLRVKPFCSHFGECGGCRWQNLPYEEQLKYKQKQVSDQFERIGKIRTGEMNPILPSENQIHYRNKLEYTFSENRWLTREEMQSGSIPENKRALGFHIPGRFDKVLDIRECYLQPEPSDRIRNFIREYAFRHRLEFFDLVNQQGFLRTLIIRNSQQGEFMVVVSFFREEKEAVIPLMEELRGAFPQIVSLFYVINPKANDTLNDLEPVLFFGKDHLVEEMEGLKFRIGPKSFYQTNPRQAQRLYSVVRDFAKFRGDETVYDIYSGTGTIALFVARKCDRVIGLEYLAEAVEDARQNATLNAIGNAFFYAGDCREILTPAFFSEKGSPDIIIVDPPRSGMHADVVRTIANSLPQKIIYVSCNPATQARDIQLMSGAYKVTRLQPVDMFPHTFHVENVALMERI